MAAYIHAQITVTDPEAYEAYRREVAAVLAAHGGRFLVRGGAVTVLESDGSTPGRQVILEFPDMATLRGFYDSPEYQRLVKIRQGASQGRLIAIEGVA